MVIFLYNCITMKDLYQLELKQMLNEDLRDLIKNYEEYQKKSKDDILKFEEELEKKETELKITNDDLKKHYSIPKIEIKNDKKA